MTTEYFLMEIPNGAEGIRATLEMMHQITDKYKSAPVIRELALKLVQNVAHKDEQRECQKIHAFVRDKIRYVKDVIGVETLQSPVQTLRLKQGDCDDKSMLVASLLGAIGKKTRFVAVGFEKGRYSHVFPQVQLKEHWITMETTEPWPMGRYPKGVKSYMIKYN